MGSRGSGGCEHFGELKGVGPELGEIVLLEETDIDVTEGDVGINKEEDL